MQKYDEHKSVPQDTLRKLRQEDQDHQPHRWAIVRVKTKTQDGGSPLARPNDESDSFSRFSNDNVRMMRLLQLDTAGDDIENDTSWRERIGYQGLGRQRQVVEANRMERKTKLSMELHPDAFYQD